jgi:4-amino-4-deoxy-L-arabinose transferase-like glycosyltransferase
MPSPAGRALPLLAVLVLAIALRAVGLGQYPQVHPDEGFWACGSRNLVLYGDGLLDGRLHPFLSPATFALLAAVFRVVPPDLVTARAVSAVLGVGGCVLLAWIAWRAFPRRPWLPVLLLAVSSLAVLVQRMILLEANQTFWLSLAAACWLAPGRPRPVAAGLAFGVALLAKSNSLYLLPAFLLTPPDSPTAGRWRVPAAFVLACVLLAAGVYGALYAAWPEQLLLAFAYELDGARLAGGGELVRVGRFGLHPQHLGAALRQLAVTDFLLVLGGLAGLALVAAGWRAAAREDRFFAVWLAAGAAFTLGQVYVEHRYLTTLAPALAFLAARAAEPLLERRRWRVAVAALLIGYCALHLGRVGSGALVRRPNADYWRVVAWFRREVPKGDRILASPSLNLSLPQEGHDFYRSLTPYDGPRRTLAEVVARLGVSHVVVDAEWRQYQTADVEGFLGRRCRLAVTIGEVSVYEVVPD